MKSKATVVTEFKKGEGSLEYKATRAFLMAMCKKYDVEPSKLVIGMQFGEMYIYKHDPGAYPVWQTLEILTAL